MVSQSKDGGLNFRLRTLEISFSDALGRRFNQCFLQEQSLSGEFIADGAGKEIDGSLIEFLGFGLTIVFTQ